VKTILSVLKFIVSFIAIPAILLVPLVLIDRLDQFATAQWYAGFAWPVGNRIGYGVGHVLMGHPAGVVIGNLTGFSLLALPYVVILAVVVRVCFVVRDALSRQSSRRASLLVAFSLLISAATAHAECAWVLWTKTITEKDAGAFITWHLRGDAAPTKPECEKDLKTISDLGPKGVMRGMKGERIVTGYFCLPDTIDPRGPKGK